MLDLEDEGWYIKSILKHISTLALRKKIIVMIYNVILLRFHCIMTLKLPPSRYLAAVDLETIYLYQEPEDTSRRKFLIHTHTHDVVIFKIFLSKGGKMIHIYVLVTPI